jgi:DNA damage-inducible protein 1
LFCSRPRITISVIAPNTPLDQELLNYDVPAELSVAGLKDLVENDTQIPPQSQQFYLNNTPISGNEEKTLEEAGVKDGDMLAMLMRQPQSENNMAQQRRGQPQQQGQRRGPPQAEQEIERARASILQNANAMAQVREQRPALADAINDPARFREVWMEMVREDEDRERERLEQMRLLNEDPFNVDAQRKIEEMIRQQAVQDNLQFAYEHNPEGKIPPSFHRHVVY